MVQRLRIEVLFIAKLFFVAIESQFVCRARGGVQCRRRPIGSIRSLNDWTADDPVEDGADRDRAQPLDIQADELVRRRQAVQSRHAGRVELSQFTVDGNRTNNTNGFSLAGSNCSTVFVRDVVFKNDIGAGAFLTTLNPYGGGQTALFRGCEPSSATTTAQLSSAHHAPAASRLVPTLQLRRQTIRLARLPLPMGWQHRLPSTIPETSPEASQVVPRPRRVPDV